MSICNRDEQEYFLPHHAVFKDNTTFKIHVVLMAQQNQALVYLNDALRVGPTIQEDIFSVLLRAYIPKYILITDKENV
jgi:hypothetical protein